MLEGVHPQHRNVRVLVDRPQERALRAAAVVWLMSSVRGPVDVIELDGRIDAQIRRLTGF